jgi:hypothetical protein
VTYLFVADRQFSGFCGSRHGPAGAGCLQSLLSGER